MNAAVASFQFTGSRQDCHHSTRSDSTFQASYDRCERLDAVAQRRGVVVEVDPRAAAPQLAPDRDELRDRRRAGCPRRRPRAATRTCCARRYPSTSRGTGRRSVRRFPLPSTSFTPRWRQALWKARTVSASSRTTMIDWSRISYSTKSPGLGISSSRHAICHTRGQNSSASSA